MPGTLFVCGRTLLQALEPVQAAHATGLVRRAAAHVQPRPVQGHRLLARARHRRHDPCGATRGAARGARCSRRDCCASTSGSNASACVLRSATTAAFATGPTCSRSSAPPGSATSPRGGATRRTRTPPPGCSRSRTTRRGTPTSSSFRSSSGSTSSGSTSTATTLGRRSWRRLKGAVDEIADNDLVYGACFHDWVMLASDERRVGWLRGFLRYARERDVEVTTYTDYWRRSTRPSTPAGTGVGARNPGGRLRHRRGDGRKATDVRQNAVSIRGKCGPWIGSPGAHSSSSSV